MKSDCNRLVEQSEMNQSVDENFNSLVSNWLTCKYVKEPQSEGENR
jgi:hypothetical protein